MTTATTDTARPSVPAQPPAPQAVAGVPFSRLLAVELRKMVDTRAGRWLLITIGIITAGVVAIVLFATDPKNLTFGTFIAATATPQALLLPLLGVLAVTSEWSQRTGLVTFTLEPRRLRVVWAKLIGAVLLGLVALALALALAAAANGLGMALFDGNGAWDLTWATAGGVALSQVIGVAQGVGFGLLFLNTPVAIVSYLLLPTVWLILGNLVSWLDSAANWLDMTRSNAHLLSGDMTGQYWAQYATSTAVWVLLPLVVGTWRLLRREVK